METKNKLIITNADTEWEMLEFKSKWASWCICSKDREGNVQLDCDHDYGSETTHLTQDEIKEIIAFLQRQII